MNIYNKKFFYILLIIILIIKTKFNQLFFYFAFFKLWLIIYIIYYNTYLNLFAFYSWIFDIINIATVGCNQVYFREELLFVIENSRRSKILCRWSITQNVAIFPKALERYVQQHSPWLIRFSPLSHQVIVTRAQTFPLISVSTTKIAVFANATRFPMRFLRNWRFDADVTWRITGADKSRRAWRLRWMRSRWASGTGLTRLVFKINSIDTFRICTPV